jgi:hypothetical protein
MVEKEGLNKKVVSRLSSELVAIKEEVRNDVTGPVVASFGFIIALIWRDAIQAAIQEFLLRSGLASKEYLYQFVSAIMVTIIVIIIMVTITKVSSKRKQEKIDEALN